MACGILVPPPGFQLMPPAGKAQSPSYWTTREVPGELFKGNTTNTDLVFTSSVLPLKIPIQSTRLLGRLPKKTQHMTVGSNAYS